MTDSTTQLTRLRARMLATAYSNADFWTQRTAFLTDQAVAALARRDRAAAEALGAITLIDTQGRTWNGREALAPPDAVRMRRVGKKAAGRLLDGASHDAAPMAAR